MPPYFVRTSPMGVFSVRVRVYSLTDERLSHEIELTVDTGAMYPVLPRGFAEELKVRPVERRTFVLANGMRIERDVGHVGIEYAGRHSPTPVILGEPGDAALLGALALEGLGFEADPGSKSLRPVSQYLMPLRTGSPPRVLGA